MSRLTVSGALGLVALTLAACGSSAPAHHAQSAAKVDANARAAIATAHDVCSTVPPRKFANDFALPTTDVAVLAHRYARGYDVRFRERVEATCLAALQHQR